MDVKNFDDLEKDLLVHNIFRALYLVHANDPVNIDSYAETREKLLPIKKFLEKPKEISMKDLLLFHSEYRYPITTEAISLLTWFENENIDRKWPRPVSSLPDSYYCILAHCYAYWYEKSDFNLSQVNSHFCKIIREEAEKYTEKCSTVIGPVETRVDFVDMGEPLSELYSFLDSTAEFPLTTINFFGMLEFPALKKCVRSFYLEALTNNDDNDDDIEITAFAIPYFLILHFYIVYRAAELWAFKQVVHIYDLTVFDDKWIVQKKSERQNEHKHTTTTTATSVNTYYSPSEKDLEYTIFEGNQP